MKKFFKFLMWFLIILIVTVIVGGFIFLKTFDLNKYKSYAEDMVYQQTGRKLVLKGEAGLKISLIPTIVLNDVSLSNAEWAKPESMIKAKSLEVSVDIMPLLKKEVVINTVNLVEPEVNLSVNKDGTPNWAFSSIQSAEKSDKNVMPEPVQEAAKTAMVIGIVAKHLQIDNGKVVYQDLKSGSTHNVQIKSFNLTSDGMDDNINIDFDMNYNGQKISGKAETGSINSVLQNRPNFPVKADVKAYGATVRADMVLNDILGELSFSGKLNAVNPSGNFGAPSVKLNSEISGSLKSAEVILKELNVAGNIITGKVKANLEKAKPNITADLNSNQIDLQSLTETKQAMVFELVSNAAAAEFVPDTPLDLNVLNSMNGKIKANITKMVLNKDVTLENVQVTAKINDGSLVLQPLSLGIGGGTVNGTVSIKAQNNVLSADLVGQNIVLQNAVKQLALNDNTTFGIKSGGQTDLKIKLNGQGKTVRKIVESLNGQIIAVVGKSQLQTGSLKYLNGNFVTQLLNALNLKSPKDMTLTCAVIRTDLAGGKAVFPKGIVFNAEQLSLVGNGSVNLINDKLDFTLHPFNNKLTDTNIAQALTSLLKVSGTVEKPSLAVDSTSVIKNVVGVAAAGPAFLGSQVLLDGDDSPCYTALKGTSYQNMFPEPKGLKSTSQGIYQGTNELLDDSVNALKDTAKGVLNILKGKK